MVGWSRCDDSNRSRLVVEIKVMVQRIFRGVGNVIMQIRIKIQKDEKQKAHLENSL